MCCGNVKDSARKLKVNKTYIRFPSESLICIPFTSCLKDKTVQGCS